MSQQLDLGAFASEEGRTDDPRETVSVGDPADGHAPHADPNHDHWNAPQYRDTPLPTGVFSVVIDPENVEVIGRKDERPVIDQPGVYLKGKQDIGPAPPTPIEASDDALSTAASAAVETALEYVDPKQLVAVGSGSIWPTLIIAVADENRRHNEVVFDGSRGQAVPGALSRNPDFDAIEFDGGFHYIREFGTPREILTDVDAPRLSLEDLDVSGWLP